VCQRWSSFTIRPHANQSDGYLTWFNLRMTSSINQHIYERRCNFVRKYFFSRNQTTFVSSNDLPSVFICAGKTVVQINVSIWRIDDPIAGDARMRACKRLHDNESCTRLQNYTIVYNGENGEICCSDCRTWDFCDLTPNQTIILWMNFIGRC